MDHPSSPDLQTCHDSQDKLSLSAHIHLSEKWPRPPQKPKQAFGNCNWLFFWGKNDLLKTLHSLPNHDVLTGKTLGFANYWDEVWKRKCITTERNGCKWGVWLFPDLSTALSMPGAHGWAFIGAAAAAGLKESSCQGGIFVQSRKNSSVLPIPWSWGSFVPLCMKRFPEVLMAPKSHLDPTQAVTGFP